MKVLALDLSKSSTGWALCDDESAMPDYGSWELGIKLTSDGRVYANLHRRLSDLNSLGKIDAIFYEEALNPMNLNGKTNINSLRILSGLCAHTESWGYAMGCRIIRPVNLQSWRKFYIGKMDQGTKSKVLKDYTMERCQQLGFSPKNDDESDALGILDYSYEYRGITPPWRKDEVLRPALGIK